MLTVLLALSHNDIHTVRWPTKIVEQSINIWPGFIRRRGFLGISPSFDTDASPQANLGVSQLVLPQTGIDGVVLRGVTIDGSQDIRPIARRWWKPSVDSENSVALSLDAKRTIDAHWVERQFAENAIVDHPMDVIRVNALTRLINKAYLDNGYINSGVIVGKVDAESRLHVRLIFGHLNNSKNSFESVRVHFQPGSRGLSRSYIKGRLKLSPAKPFNIHDLDRKFRLLAESPEIRTISVDIQPGEDPGEAGLDVLVRPQSRIDAYTVFSNARSPSVGGERIGFGGSARHILRSGDIILGEYGITRGLSDFDGSYRAPLIGSNLYLSVHGGFNKAAVVDTPLVPLDIRSQEYFYEGGLQIRLVAEPLEPANGHEPAKNAIEVQTGVLVTHRRVDSFLLGAPFSFNPGAVDGRTEYTAGRFVGSFVLRGTKTVAAAALTASTGFSGTQSSLNGVPEVQKHFFDVLARFDLAHRLDSKGLEVRARVIGQLSTGRLYSPERLSVGGRETVRGYREGLLLADDAVITSLEFARPVQFGRSSVGPAMQRAQTLTPSIFFDSAFVHNHGAPQPIARWLGGVGGALDWSPTDWFSANFTAARALRSIPAPGDRDLQDRGFSFRVIVHPLALLGGPFR